MTGISHVLNALLSLSEKNNFSGYDPYDGLNLFNSMGRLLKTNSLSRLVLIHLNKRSIFNVRPILGIKPDVNPKTLALFLSGLIKQGKIDETAELVELIKQNSSPMSKNAAWGYYFDWQSRVFFQPAHTPTVVASSFVVKALLDLYVINSDPDILRMVESSISFITQELNLFEDKNGICFSYSPLDNSIIYNASALGLEVVARYLSITSQPRMDLELLLEKGLHFLIAEQNPDGSWYYGKKPIQHFIDHYHTAYILESLENIDIFTNGQFDLKPTIKKGLDFYIDYMFTEDFAPKYFKNGVYPIESHCAGAAMKALCVLSERHGKEYFDIALKIADWTIKNMYDPKGGCFYYQKCKFWTNKINYLRWSQAWMFAGLSNLEYYGKKYGYTFD